MRFTGGLPETACGLGSTLRVTKHLRTEFPALLFRCNIWSLVDAPCGDCNWISHTDLSGIEYHGIDASADHLRVATTRQWDALLRPRRQTFESGDLLRMHLPTADAILCREFFQHLPTRSAYDFIQKVRGTGFTWFLGTSFDNDKNQEIGSEMFRPLNLRIEPFSLGVPEHEIADPQGSGRILGAWRL
jgi:hypothetical protein